VIDQGLNAEFTSIISGQIAENDQGNVEVKGTAAGANQTLLIAVGPRGNTATTIVSGAIIRRSARTASTLAA
jgi:hypothetical protein